MTELRYIDGLRRAVNHRQPNDILIRTVEPGEELLRPAQ